MHNVENYGLDNFMAENIRKKILRGKSMKNAKNEEKCVGKDEKTT